MSHYCRICGKELGVFTFEYQCGLCGKLLCNKCAKEFNTSHNLYWNLFDSRPVHFADYFTKNANFVGCKTCVNIIKEISKKIDIAYQDIGQVKTYSKNYLGKIPKETKPLRKLSTPYFRDKAFALNTLKAMAFFNGYRIIYDVKFKFETDSERSNVGAGDGTHYFKVWSYEGNVGG